MANFKRQIKCISADCNNKVEQVNTFCDDCKKKRNQFKIETDFEKKIRQSKEEQYNRLKQNKLQVNNKEGHNQHTPKDQLKPKEIILTDIEAFSRLSPEQQKEWLGKEGNALYRELREIRPRQIRFTKFRNLYEARHFGWKMEE